MTREEFDVWIGKNRKRLIRVAWAVVGKVDAEDAVQNMIVSTLANKTYEKATHTKNLIAFFSMNIRREGYHRRRARGRESTAFKELAYITARAGALQGRSKRRPKAAE